MDRTAGEVAPGPLASQPRPGVWLTDVTLLLMALIWGVNFVVIKFATGIIPALAFNVMRVSLAAAALLLLAAASRGAWPNRKGVLSLLALGALGNGIYQLFYILGIARTRAGDASLLIAATPAFIAIIGRLRGIERVSRRAWGGILLSIVGIGFVSSAAVHSSAQSSLFGDLLILCGSLCWAIYTVLLKPYTHDVDGLKLSALTMLGGSLTLSMFAWRAVIDQPWGTTPRAAWEAMAFSGIGALVIAYLFWYRGVRVIGPTRTAMYSNLQPIFAVAAAWLVLGELPTVWQGVGAASIMSGLALTRS